MTELVQNARPNNRRECPPVRLASAGAIERCARLVTVSQSRGLRNAARVMRGRLLKALNAAQHEIDDAIYHVNQTSASTLATTRDVFDDLSTLHSEYPDLEVDFANQTISVTTEPIELEEIYLGQFKIVLELKFLSQTKPYRIETVDPNPASSCDSTTHPHVQSESLCEGEAHLPIKNALADVRLHDFFTIVNQTLNTYNAGSAYVLLSDWSGDRCRDCGDLVRDDEISSCNRCDGQICGECTCSCEQCSDVYCDDCVSMCDGCKESYCEGCISSCDRCDQPYCEDCLTENQCDDCHEKENETTTKPGDSAKPAVHTVCLGEVAVPA